MSLKLSDEVKTRLKKVGVLALTFASGFILGDALANKTIVKPPSVEHIILTPENSTVIQMVTPVTIKKPIEDILASDPSKPFYLLINGPGGQVDAGLKLVALLRVTPHVKCIAIQAMSMDFSILQACSERLVTEESQLMQHLAWTQAQGNFLQLQKLAEELFKLDLARITPEAKRLELSPRKFFDLIKEDLYLNGVDQILSLKAADREVTVSCSKSLIDNLGCKLYD